MMKKKYETPTLCVIHQQAALLAAGSVPDQIDTENNDYIPIGSEGSDDPD